MQQKAKSYSDFLAWSPHDVINWLRSLSLPQKGLPELLNSFLQHEITGMSFSVFYVQRRSHHLGRDLADLSEADLRDDLGARMLH